ncbi:MAG: ABC transporter permease subunit [Pseudoxanthomonas sp.]
MSPAGARWSARLVLLLGFAFLYLPIASLMASSFNASRLATVWSGFSLRWYGELLRDGSLLAAAWVSLKVAFWTANTALVLGTMAALVLTRMRRFRGRTLFAALVTAPLVMPDIIIGLSLLLLFVAVGGVLGSAPHGAIPIWLAHTTFTLGFVSVLVSSRLQELDPALEEAAMDLGAGPVRTFFQVTLPVIAPAMVAAWLLAFTLSLDDVVIASFVAGPDATTLPVKVFSSVRMGLSPKINALATLMMVGVSLLAALAWGWRARSERHQRMTHIGPA